MAVIVLCEFWQSEILLKDLNITDALHMLKIHFEQIEELSRSLINVFYAQPDETIKDLLELIQQKCDHFCNDIALPAKLKLRQMQNELF